MPAEFRQLWAENIMESVGTGFIHVLSNNLFVLILLWSISVIWWYLFRRSGYPLNRILTLAACTYLVFFIKEGLRVFSCVQGFSADFGVPGGAVLATLILPHGILEYLAFAAAAIFAMHWLSCAAGTNRVSPPGLLAALLPASLLTLAALIESTVTPYLFALYLLGAIP